MIYVSMSEATNWNVLPWQWPKAPEYWVDKLSMYFQAKAEVMPILLHKHANRVA